MFNALARQLLQVDSCILCEDEKSLVLTLRFDKEVIRRNYRFLAAIAEYSLSSGTVSVLSESLSAAAEISQPTPVRAVKRHHWLISACAAVCLGMVLTPLSVIGASNNPLENIHIALKQEILAPGDPLELVIAPAWGRYRTCFTTVHRFVTRLRDHDVVYREALPGTWQNRPEGKEYTVKIKLPTLEPGRYIYHAELSEDCGAKSYFEKSPDLMFQVAEHKPEARSL